MKGDWVEIVVDVGGETRTYEVAATRAGRRVEIATRRGPGSRAAEFVDLLLARSDEFAGLWSRHEVGLRPPETKVFVHPELGELELSCQTLLDPDQSHSLLVYTAVPGSETHDKLQLLAVIGAQSLS